MSEDQITRSTAAAAKAARRAAIAVAPLPDPIPEPPAPEPVEAAFEAAAEEIVEAAAEPLAEMTEAVVEMAEPAVELAEAALEALPAEIEAVSEAVEAAPEAVLEAAVEIVAEPAPLPEPPKFASRGAAFAERSMRGLRAYSDASTALTQGVQEASRTWLAATQSGMKLQRDGFKRLSACRSLTDLVTAQGDIVFRGLETAAEAGESIARTSSRAIDDAGRALRHAGA